MNVTGSPCFDMRQIRLVINSKLLINQIAKCFITSIMRLSGQELHSPDFRLIYSYMHVAKALKVSNIQNTEV